MARLRLEEHSATLKPWLFNHLEPISEADPNVLSEYILALLRHDSAAEDLKQLCTSQLEDFLGDETFAFVTKLFHFLSNPPSIPLPSSGLPQHPPPLLHDSARGVKRPFDGHSAHQPDAKLARSSQSSAAESLPTGPAAMRREPGPSGGGQARDRWAPTGLAGGAERPFGWRGGAPLVQGSKLAGLCKDYHYKGYCARGDLCQYQHDEASPHISPLPARSPASESRSLTAAPPFPSSLPLQQPRPFFTPPPRPPYSPYLSPCPSHPQNFNGPPHPFPTPSRPSFPPRGSGPPTQRPDIRPQSTTTLVVENVPRDALTLPSVQLFFGTFGSVVNITIDQPGLRAVVTFATPDQAHRALVSPEAVFGNRFVRVYRQRLDIADRTSSSASSVPFASFSPNLPSQDPSNRPFFPSTSPPLPVPANPAVEAAARHQREAQRKAQAVRAGQLQASASRQKELMERLEEPGLTAADRSTIMQALRKLASLTSLLAGAAPPTVTTSAPTAGSTDGTVDLDPRAQLAQLRTEAKALGIDTSTPRGRGRGLFRGLGRSARGRGGPPRTFRLDNRTTKLLLRDISEPSSLPVLRTYFEEFGEVVRLGPVPNTPDVLLEFKTRVSAEQALSRGSTIPGVGRLSIQWSHIPSSASTPLQTGDPYEQEQGIEVKMETDEGERPEREGRLSRHDDEEDERSWNR